MKSLQFSTFFVALIVCSSASLRLLAKDEPSQNPTVPSSSSERKVISSAELSRAWSGETRSFRKTTTELRSTNISAEHLKLLRAQGASRGISVVPSGGGGGNVSVSVDPASSVVFQNILFKLNSTEFADKESVLQVKEIAKAIMASGGKTFLLEGHTCDLGSETHNHSLSERRAAAILGQLLNEGVSAAQLLPLGFGESKPAVPNTSESNREANRRVVISVRPTA